VEGADLVEEASVVVVLAVAVVSTAVAFVVALWLSDTLEAEPAAAVVESASGECTSQVEFRTLLA